MEIMLAQQVASLQSVKQPSSSDASCRLPTQVLPAARAWPYQELVAVGVHVRRVKAVGVSVHGHMATAMRHHRHDTVMLRSRALNGNQSVQATESHMTGGATWYDTFGMAFCHGMAPQRIKPEGQMARMHTGRQAGRGAVLQPKQPPGCVCFAGPAGRCKTLTLFAALLSGAECSHAPAGSLPMLAPWLTTYSQAAATCNMQYT